MKTVSFKKLFSAFLALVIIVGAVPFAAIPASAATTADGIVYTISGGQVTITGYTGSATELNIPAEIEGYPVTTVGSRAFNGCTMLINVALPDSLVSIETEAFYDCYNLKNAVIPDGVTTIGNYAYWNCYALKSVTIPHSVSYLGRLAFWAENIINVYYDGTEEKFNSLLAANGNENLFFNAQFIFNDSDPSVIPIPEGLQFIIDDGQVIIKGYGGSATEFVIPATIKGYPVTTIDDEAFDWQSNLTSIILPESLTNIGNRAFAECDSLETIIIPEGVTSMGTEVFDSCDNLKSIILPEGLTVINHWAFDNCISLEGITIPEGVTTIGRDAFFYCDSLRCITLPNSVTSVGPSAFFGCSNLSTVYFEGTEEEWNAIFINPDNECLTNAEIIFLGEAEEPEFTLGDIDGDGSVNGKDSYYLACVLAGMSAIEEGDAQYLAADIDGDGIINGKDAFKLKCMIAGSLVV